MKTGQYWKDKKMSKKTRLKGGLKEVAMLREAFASCAIDGNRVGEICGETFDRIMTGQGVSDRYLLGLAWFIRNMEEQKG